MRVFGLYVAFRGSVGVLDAAEAVFRHDIRSYAILWAITGVVLLLAGVLAWRKADQLGAYALREEPRGEADEAADAQTSTRLGALDIHAIAFTVLGVYLLVIGFGHAASGLGLWIQALRHTGSSFADDEVTRYQASTALAEVYTAAAYVVAGSILAIGARSLASLSRRLWWRGRGVVRANRFELVDFSENLRAHLAIEEATLGDEQPQLALFDQAGNETARWPADSNLEVGARAEGSR
jgi:hypothetical protein